MPMRELSFVLGHHWRRFGLNLDDADFSDATATTATARITGGNFRLQGLQALRQTGSLILPPRRAILVDARRLDAGGGKRIALQIQHLTAVGLRDPGVADQHRIAHSVRKLAERVRPHADCRNGFSYSPPTPRPDHASYIDSWLKVLKADKKAIFTAASAAAKAADFLTGLQTADITEAAA